MSTGCRASSACAVKLKTLILMQICFLLRTKNSKPIILPLGKYLSLALRQYISMWRYDASPDDYVFPSVYDTPLTVNGLKLAVKRYNTARGIDSSGVHKIRHTFAKEWVRSGGDIYKLQKVLGHREIRMTMHYANIFGADLAPEYEQHNMLDRIKSSNSKEHSIKRKAK